MHIRRKISWLVLPVAVALLAAGCGGGGGSGAANSEGTIRVYGTDPENPLIPTDTNEVGGGRPVDAMWAGLVKYSPDDYAPSNLMAESITPNKNSTRFDIKIKKGWKFHNGQEVTAKSFVDAWNYGAYGPNGQNAASFFSSIKGYNDVNLGEDSTAKPKTNKMSGLKVVNDYEFTATMSEPFAVFPTTLGYSAFYPMPDAFFKDPKGFEKHPIGNGEMKFVDYKPKTAIDLVRNDDYKGSDRVHFKNLQFKIYDSRDPAYQDLQSGGLDFMEDMPPAALAGDKYRTDLDNRVVDANLLSDEKLNFPLYVKKMANPDLHKAISMAIDRAKITKQIFSGTRTPEDGWVAPEMPGAVPGACGEFCKYNPQMAKQYLKKSGFTGKLTIASNSDGGHKEWIEAVCGSIRNTLGIDCNFAPATNFGAFRQQVNADKMTGPYRSGWVADYPSVQNFLAPLYVTGASSNDGKYSSKAFDAAVKKADAASSPEQANKLYSQAEKILARDMPSIPLWTQRGVAGYSDQVSNVKMTPKRDLDLSSVTANG